MKIDEFMLTLNSPITEEQWDAIADVDFDNTEEIEFHTKHGKTVRFKKENEGQQKSGRYVDLSERVIGYYYDDEYEEWIEKTVTVEELLDTACDDYTVVEMPSTEPQRMKGKWIKRGVTINCSICKHCNWSECFEQTVMSFNYCPNCGADMRGRENDKRVSN
jgi:hypothetical protein